MSHPYGAFCDDFYVNMRLGSQLSLPHNRETLLHFFERVQKQYPTMSRFRKTDGGDFNIEEDRSGRSYRWTSLEQKRISAGHVRLSDVTFGYDPEAPVLHDVSIDVPAGSFVGIVGHTASGKTTLLSLLLRFYTPQAGRIEIDGIPLTTIGDEHFRADVGLVLQEPFLLAASAHDNIDMGRLLPAQEIEHAARAASRAPESPRRGAGD